VDVIDLDEVGRKLEGVLAVQVHVGPAMTIQYKDFEIKHLPDEFPLQIAADHPIPEGAIGARPQGRTPNGWTPPIYGQQKNNCWPGWICLLVAGNRPIKKLTTIVRTTFENSTVIFFIS